MAGKPFQFRLATLVWLVVISALLCGTIRFLRTTAGNFFMVILMGAIFAGPLILLFLRPNPLRGRKRPITLLPNEPAAPLDQRLERFLGNVTPIETPEAIPPPPPATILSIVTDGSSLRPRDEIGHLLRRIHGTEPTDTSDQTPSETRKPDSHR